MISIVIPAHNESAVIARTLRTLLDGAPPGIVEVIVVCNGCNDDTADIARRFGPPVNVLETPIGSKVGALNMADRIASGFPRFYVDADVRITWESIRRIADVLEGGEALAAAPVMAMDFSSANCLVRGYYRVWSMMPYTREGFMGVGVYALSEAGRKRFGEFPDIIADDAYVRIVFASSERTAVLGCTSTIAAPSNLRGLIRIKTRSRLGLYQLRQRFPDLVRMERAGKRYAGAAREVLRRPGLWLAAMPYLLVNAVSRLRAWRQQSRLGSYRWERDDSSRASVAGTL